MKFTLKSQKLKINIGRIVWKDSFGYMETAEEGLSGKCKKWIRAQALKPCGHAHLRSGRKEEPSRD